MRISCKIKLCNACEAGLHSNFGKKIYNVQVQANMASQSVHATVMDPDRKKLDPRSAA